MITVNDRTIELKKWLGTDENPRRKTSTRKIYKIAFEKYAKFSKMTARQMIQKMAREYKGERTEMGGTANKIIDFQNHLLRKEKLAEKTAQTCVGAIRGFYAKNRVKVEFDRGDLLIAHVKYERRYLSRKDVRKLLDSTNIPRNKAIILCLYQSGMDISTLLNLNYGDVGGNLRRNRRIMITTIRKKTREKYRTFFGKDAVNHLITYIETKKRLSPNDPLFTNEPDSSTRMRTITAQRMMRTLVVRSGLITKEELKDLPFNPFGSHALRESFSKTAAGAGLNQNVIDGMLGHKVGYDSAYSKLSDFELENIYSGFEAKISTSSDPRDQMEVLREIAQKEGINLDDLLHKKGLEAFESGMGTGGGYFPNFEDPEVARDVLMEELRKREKPKVQKIVKEDELEGYLEDGWLYVSSLNNGSHKCIISKN